MLGIGGGIAVFLRNKRKTELLTQDKIVERKDNYRQQIHTFSTKTSILTSPSAFPPFPTYVAFV